VSSEEARVDKTVQRLVRALKGINAELRSIVSEVAVATSTSSTYWNGVASRIRRQYEAARIVTREWTKAAIPKEYTARLADAIRQMKATTFTPNKVNIQDVVNKNGVKQSANTVVNDAYSSFLKGLMLGQNNLLRLSSVTQQVVLSEAKVNKSIAEGYIEQGSAQASKVALRDALLQKAIDGKYITVVDKNGAERSYEVDSYAELVARTKLIDAATTATIDTAREVGADLVQVSSHNTLCDVCKEFEGKIYSLSGQDSDFPQLEDEPPYHPNCMHSLTIVYREALEADGSLDDYISRSNEGVSA